jgi:phage terminase large subunit-like protein
VITLTEWQAAERRIDAAQIPEASSLMSRLSPEWVASLTPREALALRYSRAALRARQQAPAGAWLTWLLMTGRGWGKSFAAAHWIVARLMTPGDVGLIAPTLDETWTLQWETISAALPPWVRAVPRDSKNMILFPDQGSRLLLFSAQVPEFRGPNLKAAWLEEPVKYPQGATLYRNLQRALRVAEGTTPARAVVTTTPPKELDWILELAAQPTTRVTRGTSWDNSALPRENVKSWYAAMRGTAEARRELDGAVVLGVDGALFSIAQIEASRAQVPPQLDRVVIAVDPAQSAKRDADTTGIVALGIARGHLYVLASCSERLDPISWSTRAIDWAQVFHAGRYVVEPTGSGQYPRDTLLSQMRIARAPQRPIVESPARGSKSDRAQPLSAYAAQGRLHIVGSQPALERELTTWHPGAGFSPGGLDALVHGAAALTNNWQSI